MGTDKYSLEDRMKGYENISRNYLTRHIPAIIRIDGKSFHTFTKGMERPFDGLFRTTMQEVTQELCKNIQGCVFGYTQSDEITLVITDYASIKTDAWFGYNIQKMVSISASYATLFFNKIFADKVNQIEDSSDRKDLLNKKINTAIFDSRVFSIPKDEVVNCLIWRQQDATRNSIENVGQTYFSHKELNNKTCNNIQDMLFIEKGINWNDFPTDYKRGTSVYKKKEVLTVTYKGETKEVEKEVWFIDHETPQFTSNREFVEKWV